MTAYVVFIRERTADAQELRTYSEMAPAAREGRSVTPLAFYGPLEVLEGPPIEGSVILSFPSVEAAHDWYDSPEYQVAKVHRLKGADYRVFIVDGVSEAHS